MWDIAQTMAYIQSFQKGGKPVQDLSRIAALLQSLGNPQNNLHAVHVAGTNGKGSVVTLCAAAATAAGYHTGALTSPFIRRYTDRIRIDGQDIPSDVLCRLCEQVARCDVSVDCSQFEITFAIALLWFAEEECDLVFLEAGIGGLLDATNIIQNPLVCVITSISYDHTEILGGTLSKIAAQKGGIIKPGCPVVLSANNPLEVISIITQTAARRHANLVIPELLDCHILSETLEGVEFTYHSFHYALRMPGKHQVLNALTAIETIRLLGMHGFLVPAAAVSRTFSSVQVPARTQILSHDPLLLVDGGHNQAGVLALTDLLRIAAQKPVHAVFGMLATKKYADACAILGQVLDTVVCVDDFAPNAVPAKKLMEYFPPEIQRSAGTSLERALRGSLEQARQDGGMAVCGGSLYMASRVLNLWESLRPCRQ